MDKYRYSKDDTPYKSGGGGYEHKILLRGGCDLDQMVHYLEDCGIAVSKEFNFRQFHRDHSIFLRGSLEYSTEEKVLITKIPFIAKNTFDTELFTGEYDVIIYSVLMDYTQDVCHYKNNPKVRVAYADFLAPWSTQIAKKDLCANQFFLDNFVSDGALSPQEFKENLLFIRNKIRTDSKLILINGCEVALEHPRERNRYLHHRTMNAIVDDFVVSTPNTYLLDVRKFVKNRRDVQDNIRHYTRKIYFQMATELLNIIK